MGIGGAIFDKDKYDNSEDEKIKAFKREIFGNDQVVLHSHKIGKKLTPFECLKDPEREKVFIEEFNKLVLDLDFVFISRVIKKDRLVAQYVNPYPPYGLAITLIMESFANYLYRTKEKGKIVIESRGKKEDSEIIEVYNRILKYGTQYLTAEQFQRDTLGLQFRAKKDNINGLQISDMCIYPVTAAVTRGNYQRKDFKIVERKFDDYHGLKVFPK
jgi:hypothetical protein